MIFEVCRSDETEEIFIEADSHEELGRALDADPCCGMWRVRQIEVLSVPEAIDVISDTFDEIPF